MLNKIVLLTMLLIISLVFYFLGLSDPRFLSQTYSPNWLLEWSNCKYNLRTVKPFITFWYLLEFYSEELSSLEMSNMNFKYVRNVSTVVVLVCIIESVQLFIQKRSQDVIDVFFRISGSLSGAFFYNLLNRSRDAKST